MTGHRLASLALAAGLAALPITATAQSAKIEAGTLLCSLTQDSNLIILSSSQYACTFVSSINAGETAQYIAEFDAVGIDLSTATEERIGWIVLTAGDNSVVDELEGTYVGGSVDAAAGVGVGARALVGGALDSISLQPFSVSASEGYGAAIGIERMRLSAVN